MLLSLPLAIDFITNFDFLPRSYQPESQLNSIFLMPELQEVLFISLPDRSEEAPLDPNGLIWNGFLAGHGSHGDTPE